MPSSFFKEVTLREKGFSIEVELLSKFLKKNRSILEIPIKYEGRTYTEGKKIKTSDGFKYLFNTLKYKFLVSLNEVYSVLYASLGSPI